MSARRGRSAALFAAGALLLLAGCAADPVGVGGSSACPVRVREYPVAEQRRVAEMLPVLPSPVPDWIEDYGRLRAEVRAFCGRR